MEILPACGAGPSWHEGLDAKQSLQSKQHHRKAKSKQARQAAVPIHDELACNNSVSGDPASASGVSVISALQEFVQDSKAFRMPSRHSILQWHFEERCVNAMAMQFRATVAFVLEGVPHQIAGDWQSSKNLAKRDVAERALTLFVGMWGCQLLQEDQGSQYDLDSGNLLEKNDSNAQEEIDTLINFCRTFPACGQTLPELTTAWDNGFCKGLIEINIFGVLHTFAGADRNDEELALADVARRVLWYLQCPGFRETFEVDMDALATRSQDEKFSAPPSFWKVDGDM